MSDREPIRGQVARILSDRELVINRGALAGVREGMIFDVLDPAGENVIDPETGEVLGSIYHPKVQVKVAEADERMSVARTFKATRMNVGGAGVGNLGNLFTPPKWIEKHETFRTEDAAWEPLPESRSYVKVGDPVVEAFETTDEKTGARTLELETGEPTENEDSQETGQESSHEGRGQGAQNSGEAAES